MMIKGEHVTAARDLLGWTKTTLAIKAGVSETTILALERGRQRVTQPMITAIRGALEAAGIKFTEVSVTLGDEEAGR